MELWPYVERKGFFDCDKAFETTDEACEFIIGLSTKWAMFWPQSHGWAPPMVADLMNQSLMDRQLEMARSLKNWPKRRHEGYAEGELVLAWTNLGSVIEGALKIYMCVFYAEWLIDPDTPEKYGIKKTPDGGKNGASFEDIIQFMEKKKIIELNGIIFIRDVQQQRNLIHPMKSGTVKGGEIFNTALTHAAELYDFVERRLPYP